MRAPDGSKSLPELFRVSACRSVGRYQSALSLKEVAKLRSALEFRLVTEGKAGSLEELSERIW